MNALMLIAAMIGQQPVPQEGPPPAPKVIEEAETEKIKDREDDRVKHFLKTCVDKDRNGVIFVGCKINSNVRATVPFYVAEVDRLDDYPAKCIVVNYPFNYPEGRFMAIRAILPANASADQIQDALDGREVSRKTAGPFPKFAPLEAQEVGASLASFLNGEMETYTSSDVTQVSGNRSGRGASWWSPRSALEAKWQVPGGLVGVHGWSSTLYQWKGNRSRDWTDHVDVNDRNSEIIKKRSYNDGAVFADVLRHDGKVFAIRIAEKRDGQWDRYTAFRNPSVEPAGYQHVKSSMCAGCHDQAGGGGYGTARIPGGDGNLSARMHDLPYTGPITPGWGR